ncbi:hypothetical protein EDB84DRAFT_1564944 [Lactarius hengduanensis]|nr:hypothetical protein EDB84DRAFT_1564944 [Lactarius hengduanensis]
MATAAGSTKTLPQEIGYYCMSAIAFGRPDHIHSRYFDWSLKLAMRSLSHADLQLDGVEFSSLPSRLDLVEQDVMYFTKDGLRGQPGFRLSSLGILLARSLPPRPWRHVPALKALVRDLHSDSAAQGYSSQGVWEPARRFFEPRKARLEDLGGAGTWHRWSEELEFDMDNGVAEDGSDWYEQRTHASPTLHLPHLLRHVLGRRRILIYTQPPVEAACFLCQVAAGMCFEDQTTPATQGEPNATLQFTLHLKGKYKEGINVLGIITLYDVNMLERESQTGRGWIACTTDALAIKEPYARRPTYRRSNVRFTWSDVKLWTEFDRILHLDADTNRIARASCIGPSLRVRVYEEWSWAGSPRERSGRRAHVRAQGDGIEGRRASYRPHDNAGKHDSSDEDEDGAVLVHSRQTRTMLALLQTFHVQTRFLLSRLATVLPSTASFLPDAQPTPRDFLTLVLGPLSSLDARFVE